MQHEKPVFYAVSMFPYPSGSMHMGHVRNYVTTDIIARYKKQQGYEVIQPMGWDAFGLPAENAAIAHNDQPSIWTEKNIAHMRAQIKQVGVDIDWDREIATHQPSYYRWTQWFFAQMMKRGMAYQAEGEVNWDPVDQTVVANEQIDADDRAWRSGAIVQKRMMRQWYIATTHYAEEMMQAIDASGMPEAMKARQRHWIGNMHDWCVSRQRFWGTPIPVIHCPEHGAISVPESDMPVMFPEPDRQWSDYKEQIDVWKHTTCPICGAAAVRETDTMDTFVDSAWYFFRYIDPHNIEAPFTPKKANQWMPMSIYVGGMEHATGHVIYARFFTRFIRDMGMFAGNEPFNRIITQGMIQGPTYRNPRTGKYIAVEEIDPTHPSDPATGESVTMTFEKMSKSKGNGINPSAVIAKYGVDAIRMYVMFKAPVERDMIWDESDIKGIIRFIQRVKTIIETHTDSTAIDPAMSAATEVAIAAYQEAMDRFRFNVAIAQMMKFSKVIQKSPPSAAKTHAIESMRGMMSPFAPTMFS